MAKIITMFSKKEYLVEEDEAKRVAELFNSNSLVELKCGAKINPKGIESIGDIPTIPYWGGYPLNSDGTSFIRDGQKIFLEAKNFSEIEYLPDPKYKVNLLQISS